MASQIRDFGALHAKDGGSLPQRRTPRVRIDPLAGVRRPADPYVDVFCAGQVFFDIVFTGLAEMPPIGTEVWAPGMGSSPGGMANMAVALRRLGLRTWLAAEFGDDLYGEYCWETLSGQEDIDLSASRQRDGWHSPVTVSIALARDRTMVTHGHPSPDSLDQLIGSPPPMRSCFTHLEAGDQTWVRHAYAAGALVFADLGWDDSEQWSRSLLEPLQHCHVFLPNAQEAMALTRTDSVAAAASALTEHVPTVVVTDGRNGAMAIDQRTGEDATISGVPVTAIDPTGAGDVFGAAFMVGTLAEWPLADRLRFANLCAALSVQHFGGALAAPGWGEITAWFHEQDPDDLHGYQFLADLIPSQSPEPVHRAAATLARHPRPEG